ncbi:MAG: alpha/beta hydrolase [Betaproteobacteria bacterium]|nr:alpha/beta hydrolase [Betaproteobacteria bacterium]
MNSLLKLLLGLGIAYAAILALVFMSQPKLVYFPMKGPYPVTPQARGLAFERAAIKTEDGETLAAWWIPAPVGEPARGAVLLFHGNAGNIAHRLEYARMFYDMGYATLLVDYRGYGESTGTPSEPGTYRDASASWQWLTQSRGLKASDIVLFGESLGAGVATWLAARQSGHEKPRALILASTFTSVPDLGVEVYPWLPVRWLSRIHYDNFANVAQIKVPLLIAHSPQDDIIPYAHSRRLFEAANPPKTFLELARGHNDGFVFMQASWVDTLRAFLDQTQRVI